MALKVTGQEVWAWLVKCCPGHERQVAAEIRRRALPHVDRIHVEVLTAIGEYDLVVLMEGGDSRQVILQEGSLPAVLGVREIACFGIAPCEGPAPESQLRRLSHGPFLGLTFVRVPGFFTDIRSRRMGEDGGAEGRFVDWWQTTFGDKAGAHAVLLGNFGGPEFLSVVEGATMDDLVNIFETTQQAGAFVEKTFSIVGVRFDHGYADHEAVIAGYSRLGPCSVRATAEIRVACRPRHRSLLAHAAKLEFSKITEEADQCEEHGSHQESDYPVEVSLISGPEDFLITLPLEPSVDFGQVLARILRYRWAMRKALLSTVTSLRFRERADPAHEEEQRAQVDDAERLDLGFTVSPAEAKTISGLREFGHPTLAAFYAFGDLLRNPALTNDLVDMLAYFESYKNQALHANADSVVELRMLSERYSPAHHGIDQRTIGSQAGINPVESGVRHLLGGFHRAIQAAESIPLSIFRQFDASLWPGFVHIGPLRDHVAHHYQVPALPADLLFSPNGWTGLIHESVHGLLDSKWHALEATYTAGKHRVTSAVSSLAYASQIFPYLDALYEELFVDLVALNYSPCWDPGLILRDRWEYILRTTPIPPRDSLLRPLYAVRPFFALLCTPDMQVASTEGLDTRDFHHYFSQLLEIAQSWEDPVRGPVMAFHLEMNRSAFEELFLALAPVLPIIATVLPFKQDALSARLKWWQSEGTRLVHEVKQGRIPQARHLPYPELFVWKMRDDSSRLTAFAQRTAGILALVECYREQMLSFRDATLRELGPE